MLFRSLYLEALGGTVSLSDTVGFIRDLPHKLVEAFEATLQETADADLLLHVVDAASPVLQDQRDEVERVLAEIGAADVPQIVVYNKLDQMVAPPRQLQDWIARPGHPAVVPRVFVSALQGTGLDVLRAMIAQAATARGLNPPGQSPSLEPDGGAVEADNDAAGTAPSNPLDETPAAAHP